MRIGGIIERRILVNYRVAPDVLARLLPDPFRPKTVGGWGVAGICLVRLRIGGIRSENAAHRVAVEWNGGEGVYVPRRDTSSRWNALAARPLLGIDQRLARFDVLEEGSRCRVVAASRDGTTRIVVEARETDRLTDDSVFPSLEQAARFFREGAAGYSPGARPGRFQGIELVARDWSMRPLEPVEIFSSCFDGGASLIPRGAARFDSAFLMRGIPHSWRTLPPLEPRVRRAATATRAAGSAPERPTGRPRAPATRPARAG
jgi:hypothetical protein